MSLGEARVRIRFNPNDNSVVSQIQQRTADLIDYCDTVPYHGVEAGRLWDLAQTAYEEAAMWAVKAATADK